MKALPPHSKAVMQPLGASGKQGQDYATGLTLAFLH